MIDLIDSKYVRTDDECKDEPKVADDPVALIPSVITYSSVPWMKRGPSRIR